MEPEVKYEILEKIMKATMGSYNPSAHHYDIPDLSRISTRELLNECYRRRAIDKFSASIEAPIEAFEDQEHNSHLKRHLDEKLWSVMADASKFYSEAVIHSISALSAGYTRTLTGEVYICKHPSKVKK